jgi:hypothetical protein
VIFIVTTLNFKSIVDLPKWRPLAVPIYNYTSTGNELTMAIASDMRNNEDRYPYIFKHTGQTIGTEIYNVKSDEWLPITNISAASVISDMFLMPAQGPRGTLAAGATTTTVTLTTALPSAVGVNQIANRGDGIGFKIRIIGNAAGSSGKTEERYVIGNTSGTTPTITLNSALSFTPILGDAYEFLSGRVYSTNRTPQFQSIDILTNTRTTLAAPAVHTDCSLVGLDELFVPYDRSPGEGFFGILIATASGAASLTGQVAGGDTGVLANEYRNFQIRIVEDTAIPTAAGQRRNITSHTAGPSPVYTVAAWTVIPSATATYVIENNGDRMLFWTEASANTNTYTISTNTWSTVIFTARTAGVPAGFGQWARQSFGIVPDTAKNARHSFIYQLRGSGTNIIDVLDIAGAATGTWSMDIVYGNKSATWLPSTATSAAYDPVTNQGRYVYINKDSSQRFYRFDVQNRILEPMTFFRLAIAPQNAFGFPQKQLAHTVFVDGATKLSFLILVSSNPTFTLAMAYALPIIE